ncbi:MAG: hypothetical protein LBK97_03175 [Prevotellaceae bacterium]|jgi:tRNA(Ser,Leu) C12 N-acetylase TAN1|nr:hypothetical protein [Prevotellaceae bacterium]
MAIVKTVKDKRTTVSGSGRVICFAIMIFVVMLVAVSCGPQSKESYMNKYELFIKEVGKNKERYTDKDWKQKDREFEQLSGELYRKFKDDMTWKDELILAANKVKYNYYIVAREASFFKKLLDGLNVDEIKSQVKFYIDNKMEDDITALVKEAKKAGRDAEAIVNKVLNDLKVNIKPDDY